MIEPSKVIQQLMRALDDHDMDTSGASFAPDCDFTAPGTQLHGRDQVRAFSEGFINAFPDLQHTLGRIVASGGDVAMEATLHGTHTGTLMTPGGQVPPTGREMTLPFAAIYTVDEGQVTSAHLYWDGMAFMSQLGLGTGADTPA